MFLRAIRDRTARYSGAPKIMRVFAELRGSERVAQTDRASDFQLGRNLVFAVPWSPLKSLEFRAVPYSLRLSDRLSERLKHRISIGFLTDGYRSVLLHGMSVG